MHKIVKLILLSVLGFTASYGQTYYRAIIFYTDFSEISSYLDNEELDVVHNYERFTKHVDVYVSSTYFSTLEDAGLDIVLTATTVDENHKSYILGQRWDSDYGYYPKYAAFDSLLTYYETTYPKIAKTGILPVKSHYGRDIYYIKISNSPDADNKKPETCVHGVIHADEPIGAGIVRDGIDYLCKNYDKDPEIKWLVDNRQIYFLPVQNVERYLWNENQSTKNNRKRKTLDYKNGGSSNTESEGGVDPNRNFPYKWAFDNSGSSSNSTASNYRGSSAADQKCVQAIIEFFKLHNFRFWNVYHSAGEKVLIPFGHTESEKLSSYDSTAFYSVYHEWQKFYPAFDGCGPAWEYYFPINGSTEDWAWSSDDTTSKVYGYITELGPGTNGEYWFTDSKSKEMSEEMVQCDIFMAKAAGFYPELEEIRIVDPASGGGNNDGILNPGETVELYATIKNRSAVDTTPVIAYLNSPDQLIQVVDSMADYGDVEHVETLENDSDPFTFKCNKSAAPGSSMPLNINVTWTMNSAEFVKTLPCSLKVGDYVSIHTNQTHAKQSGLSIFTGNNSSITFQINLPTHYEVSGLTDLKLAIYSISGRLVKSLDYTTGKSSTTLFWDRTDDAGKTVTSGVYFLRLDMNDFQVVQRFEIVQ